jgi:hypothetical protein
MTEPLKTNDIVIYEGKKYNVRLNGTTVFMRSTEPQFTVKRSIAEKLPRVPVDPTNPEIAQIMAAAAKEPRRGGRRARTPSDVPVPEDKVSKLRTLLTASIKSNEAEISALVDKICDLFINKNTLGGVYMIRLDEVAGKPIKFFVGGKETNDFVMIKLGKADNYTTRFSQFSFKYTEVLRIDGDTTMEVELKRMLPCNWKPYFYNASMRKDAVLKAIGIPGNNGPSEWRIVKKSTYDSIVAKAKHINSLNWQKELTFANSVKFDEKAFEIEVGSDKRRHNSIILEIL